MRRLRFSIKRARGLSPSVCDEMWALFRAHYAEVSRPQFDADLAQKDHVILLVDRRDRSVKGFSTLVGGTLAVDGQRVAFVFSGDTIVAKEFWGSNVLQRAFFLYIARQKLKRPRTPLYWFLISKGYRTYLLLARNFPDHWPRYERPTPAWERSLLRHLARLRFADAYDERTNLIRHPQPHGRLHEHTAPIDPEFLSDPDIRFFVEQNPGHALGDELGCIGRIDFAMLRFYLGKRIRRLWTGGRRSDRPTQTR